MLDEIKSVFHVFKGFLLVKYKIEMLSQFYLRNRETVKRLTVLSKNNFRLKFVKRSVPKQFFPFEFRHSAPKFYKNHLKLKLLVKNIYVMEEKRSVV